MTWKEGEIMKFALKIPSDIFKNDMSENTLKIIESFGSIDNIFEFLKSSVDSIEFGMINVDLDSKYLLDSVSKFANEGIGVSFHGKLNNANCAEEFFSPYTEVIESGIISQINITVHPLKTEEETESLLRDICFAIEKNNYPVRITLENQRNKSEETAHVGCEGVYNIVKKINNPHLFLCFDFGHQLSNVRKEMVPYDEVTDGFVSMVRHTHIHSYYEGVTHFPLCMGETLLEENITRLLDKGYDETLLLELDPKRYLSHIDIKESYLKSVEALKISYKQCVDKRKELDKYKSYSSYVKPIFKKISDSISGMGLLSPSSYIFKLDDTVVGIDPCLFLYDVDEDAEENLLNLMNKCDAIIVTHKHRDHYDPSILDKISSDIPIYCADFVGYKRDNTIIINAEDKINIKNLTVEFFDSYHTLGNNVVPEIGFQIESRGEKYVFPIDVRDYDKVYPDFSNVKVLVAHLWLGKQNALNVVNNPYVNKFTYFVKKFNADKVFVSHLYGVHRKIDDMWTETHYNLIRDKINNSSMIRFGEWIDF